MPVSYLIGKAGDDVGDGELVDLDVDLPVPFGAAGPDVTEVLPRVADDLPTDPVQTQAAPLRSASDLLHASRHTILR